jgi:NAD(P)-dependent dehydrogenase (short-subunit alcohol dehydrogenase family)
MTAAQLFDLTGKVAIVTGSTKGIGRAMAQGLAEAGACVVVSSRKQDLCDTAAKEIAASTGRETLGLACHVGEWDAIPGFIDAVLERFGRIDVLVNNAGIHYDSDETATTADWRIVREAFEVNLFGAWRVAQAIAPMMRAARYGRIVNVSSQAGSLSTMSGGTPAYSTSKAALNALTRVLAGEFAGTGVLVNSVCPGWVATDMGGRGGRPVAEGAAGIIWAATLPENGPTGGFFRDGKPLAW